MSQSRTFDNPLGTQVLLAIIIVPKIVLYMAGLCVHAHGSSSALSKHRKGSQKTRSTTCWTRQLSWSLLDNTFQQRCFYFLRVIKILLAIYPIGFKRLFRRTRDPFRWVMTSSRTLALLADFTGGLGVEAYVISPGIDCCPLMITNLFSR